MIRPMSYVLTLALSAGFLAISTSLAATKASGTWTVTGSLKLPHGGAQTETALANGQALAVGGTNGSTIGANGTTTTNIVASAELYNPATGQWTITGNMTVPRVSHTATLLPNGEVLVAGGLISSTFDSQDPAIYTKVATATAELYNPSTGLWTATGSMAAARYGASAALLPNGQVLMVGGTLGGSENSGGGITGGGGTDEAELYNPSTGKWTATTSLPVQLEFGVSVGGPTTLLANGHVLFDASPALLYNPTTATWSNANVTGGQPTSLPNGNALTYSVSAKFPRSYIYQPATNTTVAVSAPGFRPSGFVLLNTGEVLAVAGLLSDYNTPVTMCELFNPSTNTWSETGSRVQTGSDAAAPILLLSGQVLSVGTNDVELYTP